MKRKVLIGLPVVMLVLVLAAATYHAPLNQFCDAPYPEWTGDPCGDSWTNPSVLDYLWPPSHWNSPTRGGLQGPVHPPD